MALTTLQAAAAWAAGSATARRRRLFGCRRVHRPTWEAWRESGRRPSFRRCLRWTLLRAPLRSKSCSVPSTGTSRPCGSDARGRCCSELGSRVYNVSSSVGSTVEHSSVAQSSPETSSRLCCSDARCRCCSDQASRASNASSSVEHPSVAHPSISSSISVLSVLPALRLCGRFFSGREVATAGTWRLRVGASCTPWTSPSPHTTTITALCSAGDLCAHRTAPSFAQAICRHRWSSA
jgi:hypothetical protein